MQTAIRAPRSSVAIPRSFSSARRSSKLFRLFPTSALLGWVIVFPGAVAASNAAHPGGELRVVDPEGRPAGLCPLEHTKVDARISGFLGRVDVQQIFHNSSGTKIEAVYVFPLPQDAAVDRMTMTVGDRRIEGVVKRREDARRIYENARRLGHVASLLDQERPNIFTQSVTNIEPGATVTIEISYVETLRYEDGQFEFVFPTVVGPRYMPGAPIGKQGSGWAPDTSAVLDASRISPPVAPPETRAGHDIRIQVEIDGGGPLFDIASELHEVEIEQEAPDRARVSLARRDVLPNRDFVLRYRTATDEIGDALFTHTDERGTYFTLILEPPRRVLPGQARPKEMIFVIDRSGSMSGFPIEKAKETMRLAIEQMNPRDTFNLMSFAGGTGSCFEHPVANTPENRALALRYLDGLHGSGGTEMMAAIRAALQGPPDPERVRIVGFMTDGYIGNDLAILDAVRRNAGTARVFAFGIGNSVNRLLLDGMAHAGRGAVEYVTLEAAAEDAAERFHERIHNPVLTDIEIDWGTLPVADIYPSRIPDLFGSRPLVIQGRLTGIANDVITLRGNTGAGDFERRIRLSEDDPSATNDALASLWARAAVRHLMMQDYGALQSGTLDDAVREEITTLGLDFGLMTQFTSFVAVERTRVTVAGEPQTIVVPVEIPAGVSYEGVFGDADASVALLGRREVARGIGPGSGSVFLDSLPASRLRVASVEKHSSPLPSEQVVGSTSEDETVQADVSGAQIARSADQMVLWITDDPPSVTNSKLTEALRDLAARVDRDGRDGDLIFGSILVRHNQVEVKISLRDMSAATLAVLKKLGFSETGRVEREGLITGTIDVHQLEALVRLDAVQSVTPVRAPRISSGERPAEARPYRRNSAGQDR